MGIFPFIWSIAVDHSCCWRIMCEKVTFRGAGTFWGYSWLVSETCKVSLAIFFSFSRACLGSYLVLSFSLMVCFFGIFSEDSYSGGSVVLLVSGWCGCVVHVAWLCGFHWSCAVLFSLHMDSICGILSWSAKMWGKGEVADYFGCIEKGILHNVSLMCWLRVPLFAFLHLIFFCSFLCSTICAAIWL